LPPTTADRAEQLKIAEAKASRNLANAPVDLQFLMRGLRTADDFIKLAEETFLATFTDVEADEFTTSISTDARRKSGKDMREIAFQNFRQCFFLSDSGCNRTYGILSGVMPTLNPALGEVDRKDLSQKICHHRKTPSEQVSYCAGERLAC
jgi:hypothetical protein